MELKKALILYGNYFSLFFLEFAFTTKLSKEHYGVGGKIPFAFQFQHSIPINMPNALHFIYAWAHCQTERFVRFLIQFDEQIFGGIKPLF